jgi:hypothetical protein
MIPRGLLVATRLPVPTSRLPLVREPELPGLAYCKFNGVAPEIVEQGENAEASSEFVRCLIV